MNILARIKQYFFPRRPKVGEVWVSKWDKDFPPMIIVEVDPEGYYVSYRYYLFGNVGPHVWTVAMKGFLEINERTEEVPE